jgi:predicted RNA binding protein YcfA (HicA-like mRNA interferase family)
LTPNTTPNIIKERKIQMSKWDKLIARICNLSKDLRFTQLQKVLETYGYRMDAPRSRSSHYTFRKQGKSPITIPKHEPIKKVYVEMVRKVVESEERENENAE